MTFFRKPYKRERSYPSAIPESQRRSAVFARMDVPAAPPVAKAAPERSETYRRLVAALPCASCGKVGRSQHAHTNFGKAKAMKNDDRDAMPLCADEPGLQGCHAAFDQYTLMDGGRAAHVEQGRTCAAQTRQRIEALGLWPAKQGLATAENGERAKEDRQNGQDTKGKRSFHGSLLWRGFGVLEPRS